GRVPRRALLLARPRQLRAPGRLPTPKLAPPRGLAPRRTSALLPGGPVGAAGAIRALAKVSLDGRGLAPLYSKGDPGSRRAWGGGGQARTARAHDAERGCPRAVGNHRARDARSARCDAWLSTARPHPSGQAVHAWSTRSGIASMLATRDRRPADRGRAAVV